MSDNDKVADVLVFSARGRESTIDPDKISKEFKRKQELLKKQNNLNVLREFKLGEYSDKKKAQKPANDPLDKGST